MPLQLAGRKPKVSLAFENCPKGNGQTEASHPRPNAAMRSDAERQVAIGTTGQIQPIRTDELIRVAVRCAQQQDKQLIWSNPPAGKLYSLPDTADRHLNGSLIAEKFLESDRDQLGILAETTELFRMSQQRE